MSRSLQLLLLSCACSLAPAAREVKVACSEDVDLPCTAPRDQQVPYTVSWAKIVSSLETVLHTAFVYSERHPLFALLIAKLTEGGEEKIDVPQEDLQNYHQTEQKGPFGAPSEGLYSLKIRNTTSCSSGTYRCTLEGPEGQRNQSGTVILKVTGCRKEHKEATFQKYRAEIVLLLALVVFYLTLIIFTCKFAQQQSIFPEFSKAGMERAFLPVTAPNKPVELVTLPNTEVV